MTKNIKIDSIELIQIRVATNAEVVEDYAAEMVKGAKFPAIKVFTDGKVNYCADGIHRILARTRNEKKDIECDVVKGTKSDAIKYALGSNANHGFRRTNADKRHAVEIALIKFDKLSDRAVAQMCMVSSPLVGEIRSTIKPPEPEPTVNTDSSNGKKTFPKPAPKRIGRDGKARSFPPKPNPKPDKPEAKNKSVETDETGIEIPETILDLWEHRQYSQELLAKVSEIRQGIKFAQDHQDKLFVHVDYINDQALLNQVYEDLKQAVPHAVCPDCNGKDMTDCKLCKGSGFLSKFIWDTAVSDEKKRVAKRG